jgi:PKD repeat protein
MGVRGRDERNGAEINHSYTTEDEFLVKLIVCDDEGATSMATIKVTINNPGPKVTISASNTTIVAGEQVDFTVTSVTDNPSDMEAGFGYAWDFKDGETATTANLTHTFKKAGTYDVTLTMTDDEGAKCTASVKITVKQAVIDDGGGDSGTAGAGNIGIIAIGGLLAVIVVIVIMVLMMRNRAKPAKADNMEKAENVKKKRKVEATPAPPPPTKTEPAPAPVVKTEAPK